MLMTQTTAFGVGMPSTVQSQQMTQQQQQHRKKKGRLYSLGGNEPPKRPRGRLDRLKTVGTFDLGTEMSALGEVARSLNTQIITNTPGVLNVFGEALELRNAANTNRTTAKPVADKAESNKNTMAAIPKDNRAWSENTSVESVVRKTQLHRTKVDERESRPNYNKIELDMQSIEDISKCCEATENAVKKGAIAISDIEIDISTKKSGSVFVSRKPILRKSKHIVRSDSDTFDDVLHEEKSPSPPLPDNQPSSPPSSSGRREIVLQANYDIQFHREPTSRYDDDKESRNMAIDIRPNATSMMAASMTSCSSTASNSRVLSSDLDETAIYSPTKERMYKSADDSSQNASVDDIDTVFSDTNELERLDREYREMQRSSLQREYKSDGDTLDEVGKKRVDHNPWKNQSFENTFEIYGQAIGTGMATRPPSNSGDGTVSTTNTSETGSSSKMSGVPEPAHVAFKPIKPILKTSSRESAASSPMLISRPTQLRIDTVQTIKSASVDNATESTKKDGKKEESKSATSLFEKRFGKIRKINNLLKCKRFSTSALYEKKSTAAAADKTGTRNSSDTESSLPFSPTDKPNGGKSSESKTSLYSSKLSLFNYKAGRSLLFGKRKPSMSSTELNEIKPRIIERTRLTADYTKSYSDIHGYKSASSAAGASTSAAAGSSSVGISRTGSKLFGQREASVPPPMYRQPAHSPLSEEFYNPTGSVRLSAMELFDKFCSEDFGGLYKNEVTVNLNRRGGTCGEYQSLHEYRLGQRGLGVMQKYNRINQSRLLRQKSEPKFQFRGDGDGAMASDAAYFEEDEYDEEETEYEAGGGGSKAGEEYDDDEYDEFELEEEEEEEEEEDGEEFDEEDEDIDEELEEKEFTGDIDENSKKSTIEYVEAITIETQSDNASALIAQLSEEQLSTNESTTDVDEFFLMPSTIHHHHHHRHSKSNATNVLDDFDEYGFENKHFTLEHSHLTRATSTDTGIDDLNGDTEIRSFTLPKNVVRLDREKFEAGEDEVLTIYKLCSKESILSPSTTSPSSRQPSMDEGEEAEVEEDDELSRDGDDGAGTSSTSLALAVEAYVQNVPAEDSYNDEDADDAVDNTAQDEDDLLSGCTFADGDSIYRIDCLSLNQITASQSDSLDMLSSPSCTIRSVNTVNAFAGDNGTVLGVTVRQHLNPLDTCSTTSKMSLSLKSEIFDDLILSPEPVLDAIDMEADGDGTGDSSNPMVTSKVLAKSCEFEDFRLTPDTDASTDASNGFAQVLTDAPDVSEVDVNDVVDKFLQLELGIRKTTSTTPPKAVVETSSSSPISSTNISPNSRMISAQPSYEDIDELTAGATFTSEMTREFDALFTRAIREEEIAAAARAASPGQTDTSINCRATNDANRSSRRREETKTASAATTPNIKTPSKNTDTQLMDKDDACENAIRRRMPTRYSMQCLEPYLFVDASNGFKHATRTTTTTPRKNTVELLSEVASNGSSSSSSSIGGGGICGNGMRIAGSGSSQSHSCTKSPSSCCSSCIGAVVSSGIVGGLFGATTVGPISRDATGGATILQNHEYCRVIDVCDGSFVHRRSIVGGKLQSNRSQSLGNLSNKTRCFPL